MGRIRFSKTKFHFQFRIDPAFGSGFGQARPSPPPAARKVCTAVETSRFSTPPGGVPLYLAIFGELLYQKMDLAVGGVGLSNRKNMQNAL